MLVTKELKDIAFKYADLASVYMVNGQFFKRAYITGNLENRVRGYNDVSRMLKELTDTKVVLALNYAPPGAEYGYFVHEGKGTSEKYGPRRYSEYAANDPQIRMMVDSYVKSEMDKMVGKLAGELDVQLSAFSKG
jgi:hypothetical protein